MGPIVDWYSEQRIFGPSAATEDKIPVVKIRHLTRAPVVEALLDIQVDLAANQDISAIRNQLIERVGDSYAPPERIREFQGLLRHDRETVSAETHDLGVQGFCFRSNDGDQIVQATREGFTFNRLTPYLNWEHLVGEARRAWAIYRELIRIQRVKRIGVRFINAIQPDQEILKAEDLRRYLVRDRTITVEPNAELIETLNRTAWRHGNSGITIILATGLGQFQNRERNQVILDIDIYKVFENSPDDNELWGLLPEFQRLKNKLFFENISELVVTLCK